MADNTVIVFKDGHQDEVEERFTTVRRHLLNAQGAEGLNSLPDFTKVGDDGNRVAVNPYEVARIYEKK